MRDNFVGVPTDCPQRDERLGWTGDLNAFAPTAAYLYDVRGVLRSWLADLAAEQRATGFVPWVVPDVTSTPSPPTALWSDAAVSVPWQLYQEYGDVDILRDCYESMAAFIRQVEGLLDEHGLWSAGSSTATGSPRTPRPTTPPAARRTGTCSPPRTCAGPAARRRLALVEAWPAAGGTFDADAHHALAQPFEL
jgi:hypothetical protein